MHNHKPLSYLLPEYQDAVAIVANGQFPSDPEVLAYLRQKKLIIACDGAIRNLVQQQIIADYVIGDGDSAEIISNGIAKNPYIFIPDQNSNDLTKAVNFVSENFVSENLAIVIFAANGLREDHGLANIALLMQYAMRLPKIIMLSDYGIFRVCLTGKTIFPSQIGQQISFFSFDSTTQVSCQNLKWPLDKLQFEYLNHGTLNQATASDLDVNCSKPILLYQAFETRITDNPELTQV